MLLFGKYTSFRYSGVFHNYTDSHCHILPGVDDGVQTIESSLEILSEYEKIGISSVVLTPHIMEDIPNTTDLLRQRFEELKNAYSGGIVMHLASENMIDTLFDERLAKKDFLPMPGGRLLVETSYFTPPIGFYERLSRLSDIGYFPVLAHPERYMYMTPSDYVKVKGMGVRFQLNLASLAGMYGPETAAKAVWLLEKGLYDFSGTDLHGKRMLSHILSDKVPRHAVRMVRNLPPCF